MSLPNPTEESGRDPLSRPSLVLGTLVAIAGTAIIFVPGLASLIPAEKSMVVFVGAIGIVGGLFLVRQRQRPLEDEEKTGDPEVRLPLGTPGTDLETQLRRIDRIGRVAASARKTVRERLYEAAVAVVRRREGVSQATAERMVDHAEWTDDTYARSFLADADHKPAVDRSETLDSVLSLRSRLSLEVQRTADAILELADLEYESGETTELETELAPGPGLDDGPGLIERETGRWTGIGALALLAGGLGVATSQPGLLLVSVVGVTYTAYAARAAPPTVDLTVERELSVVGDDDDPVEGTIEASPGDVVRVQVTVENAADSVLSDCRLVDGVPAGLEVVEGSPRLGTALRSGRSATFSYDVEVDNGTHAFGPLQVIARDASGARETEVAVEAGGEIACRPDFDETGTVPLYGSATRYTGRVTTDTGGEGVEFYATRDYRPGDPPSRIDWNRHARTRELATLLFRQERAATVVLLVDTREKAFQTPGPGERHAVARSVEAAGRVFESLLAGGDRVGLASFGPRTCWVDPGAGNEQRETVRRTLASDPAFDYDPPDEPFLPSAKLADIRKRAPVDSQFVLFSPVTDDYIETAARRLQAYGFPITVVSPDVTSGDTTGHRMAKVERQTRLNALREAGIRVVDWRGDELLTVALQRAAQGWST